MPTDNTFKTELTSAEIIRQLEISEYADKPTNKAREIVKAVNSFEELKNCNRELIEALEDTISIAKQVDQSKMWVGAAASINNRISEIEALIQKSKLLSL